MVSSPEEEQGRVSAVEPESPTAQELPEQLAARQLGDTNKGFRPLVPDNVGRYDRTATACVSILYTFPHIHSCCYTARKTAGRFRSKPSAPPFWSQFLSKVPLSTVSDHE